ncbi:hypothetical protein I4U23_010688 [Adineta vaga]|nr:hypothetical protein I4U23_010688 [Adineta vaga]
MYSEIQNEDKNKSMNERKTTNQFSYDGFWKNFQDRLKQLKDNCKNIIVVFDGISESNSHERKNPERESSIKFNENTNRLPSLLYDELLSILHNLNIQVHIATGEADPTIVKMAREKQAYILARDSDYYLYELSKGYIPLQTINFSTLQGQCYHMNDVFQNMTKESVALWATTIVYDFIGFDVLQWRKIHEDYKIWLSIIKLWLHTKTNYSKRLEVTLISLTVSFVKHIFLDTYDEIEERIPKNEELPEKPYRQYSSEKLKNYFSLKKCFQLRQSIKNYAEIFRVDEIIEKDLKECEQFYKELSIINEFAKQPFNMPLPHSCFNQFTSRLAVRLSESKHIWNDVKTFCLNDDFLFDFVKELYKFISVETILETK